MAGINKPNIPTYFNDPNAVISRNAELSNSQFSDTSGDGSYNSYLGCNRAGSNAVGLGVASGQIAGTAGSPEKWTLLDQEGNARTPQNSSLIGNIGFVNRDAVDWPSSGGSSGFGTDPIRYFQQPDSVPGLPDSNDRAFFVVADTAAADGEEMDSVTGAINETGGPIEIGDLAWAKVTS